MMYRAKIEVGLKPGHSDPEGEMTGQSLRELKYSVKSVSVCKVYEVYFEAIPEKKRRNKWRKCVEDSLQTQLKTTTDLKSRK